MLPVNGVSFELSFQVCYFFIWQVLELKGTRNIYKKIYMYMSSIVSIMQLSLSLVYVFYVKKNFRWILRIYYLYLVAPWGSLIELNCIMCKSKRPFLCKCSSIMRLIGFGLIKPTYKISALIFHVCFNIAQIQRCYSYTGKGSNSVLCFEVSSSFVIGVQDPGLLNFVPFVILCQGRLHRGPTVIHNVG